MNQESGRDALRQLISDYVRPDAPLYISGAALTALSQLPGRIPELIVGVALDAILMNETNYTLPLVPDGWIPTGTREQIILTIGLITAAYASNWLLYRTGGRLWNKAYLRSLHDIRVDTFDTLVKRDMAFFDNRQTGDIMSVLNNDVNNIQTFGKSAQDGIRFLANVGFAFVFMFLLNWQLAIIMAIMPVVLWFLTRWYTDRIEPLYDTVRETVGDVNSRLEDNIEGISTIKAFTQEDEETEAIEDISGQYRRAKWDVIRHRLIYNLSSWFLSDIVLFATFVVGSLWILNEQFAVFSGSLTAGTLLTFLLYGQSFYHPLRQLMVKIVDNYENALASSKRILELRSDTSIDASESDTTDLEIDEGHVEYRDVSFAYEGSSEQTISDVSFTAEPGDQVGIVGLSGAGKSTIVKLLFRFYAPDDGSITIDGTDISTVDPRHLRAQLGYVSQEPFLFHGTIRENIAYATDDVSDADVKAAAKFAGAHSFISNLEDGYDTQVGERGEGLSGGQRQRIAIARAVLQEPSILVLDEATSHVDNDTEKQLQQSLDALSGQQTTLVIAHRLSTVRQADRIIVLDDGSIVETGTHDELLDADGMYADLWRIQVGAFEGVSSGFFDRFGTDRQVIMND